MSASYWNEKKGHRMTSRHTIAINSLNTNDLFVLSDMLKVAVQDAISHESPPYQDPAIRIICHQIAFAGNGDLPFMKYYKDAYSFCVRQLELERANLPEKPDDKPSYTAS
jgi:hypothetical protein